jgi:hypothetical protein
LLGSLTIPVCHIFKNKWVNRKRNDNIEKWYKMIIENVTKMLTPKSKITTSKKW